MFRINFTSKLNTKPNQQQQRLNECEIHFVSRQQILNNDASTPESTDHCRNDAFENQT